MGSAVVVRGRTKLGFYDSTNSLASCEYAKQTLDSNPCGEERESPPPLFPAGPSHFCFCCAEAHIMNAYVRTREGEGEGEEEKKEKEKRKGKGKREYD